MSCGEDSGILGKPEVAEKLRDLPGVSRLVVCYWNGGGELLKRLKVNPALRKLLDKKPEIFAYGESGMATKRGLFLKDYIYFFIAHILKMLITIAEV